MPSLKIIRKRIASVKSTQKITRAMKMVAGARLNRAQTRISQMRPYAVKVGEILKGVSSQIAAEELDAAYSADGPEKKRHPLLQKREERTALYVVLSSDRGLCGGFNANVSKAADRSGREKKTTGVEVQYATVGKKARDYLARRKQTMVKDFARIFDGLDLVKARSVSAWIVERYTSGEVDAVYLVYNEFKSAIVQKPVVERILPLPEAELPKDDAQAAQQAAAGSKYIFEPGEDTLLERLVPMFVEISVYRALLESQASEFGARMSAMDAATRNAKEMIGRLTLEYNRARQAAITKELMEIIGGAEALKG